MISVPENVKITDWPTSVTWFDDNGICYSIYKKDTKRTFEESKKTIDEFKRIMNGEKICMLVDVTHSVASSKEIRNYAAENLPAFIKAIAIVSDSPLGKMLGNLFLTLKTQPYPTKMFSSETEAVAWLKQYL